MITANSEESQTTIETLGGGFDTDRAVAFELPALEEQVSSIIHEGLNDMWLLLTGEEIHGGYQVGARRDGRAIGLLWSGQVHMLTSKPAALETLRVMGIEML